MRGGVGDRAVAQPRPSAPGVSRGSPRIRSGAARPCRSSVTANGPEPTIGWSLGRGPRRRCRPARRRSRPPARPGPSRTGCRRRLSTNRTVSRIRGLDPAQGGQQRAEEPGDVQAQGTLDAELHVARGQRVAVVEHQVRVQRAGVDGVRGEQAVLRSIGLQHGLARRGRHQPLEDVEREHAEPGSVIAAGSVTLIASVDSTVNGRRGRSRRAGRRRRAAAALAAAGSAEGDGQQRRAGERRTARRSDQRIGLVQEAGQPVGVQRRRASPPGPAGAPPGSGRGWARRPPGRRPRCRTGAVSESSSTDAVAAGRPRARHTPARTAPGAACRCAPRPRRPRRRRYPRAAGPARRPAAPGRRPTPGARAPRRGQRPRAAPAPPVATAIVAVEQVGDHPGDQLVHHPLGARSLPADRVQDVGCRVDQRVADQLLGVLVGPVPAEPPDQLVLRRDPQRLGVGEGPVEVPEDGGGGGAGGRIGSWPAHSSPAGQRGEIVRVRPGKMGPCRSPARLTPSSSAPVRTGWWRRTGWPTPAGRCCCSRRSPTSAGRSAATARCTRDFVTTPSARSTRWRRCRRRSPSLGLEHHGLRWAHAPAVLGHPRPDGRWALLHRDVDGHRRPAGAGAPGRRGRLARAGRAVATVGPALVDVPADPVPARPRRARAAGRAAAGRRDRTSASLLTPLAHLLDGRFGGEAAAAAGGRQRLPRRHPARRARVRASSVCC